jgi:hypothetical protein
MIAHRAAHRCEVPADNDSSIRLERTGAAVGIGNRVEAAVQCAVGIDPRYPIALNSSNRGKKTRDYDFSVRLQQQPPHKIVGTQVQTGIQRAIEVDACEAAGWRNTAKAGHKCICVGSLQGNVTDYFCDDPPTGRQAFRSMKYGKVSGNNQLSVRLRWSAHGRDVAHQLQALHEWLGDDESPAL